MYTKFIENFQDILKNSRSIFAPYLKSSRSFTMSDKLPLNTVILLILSQLKRSLQIELSYYFYQEGDISNSASTSAFVQARQKIKWELFQKLNELILENLDSLGLYQTRHGGKYKRVAIDGFKNLLPNTPELAEAFGVIKNQHKRRVVMGAAAVAVDLETHHIIKADLTHVNTSEKGIVTPWLKEDYFDEDTLIIYDRFYAGYAFIYEHKVKGIHCLMRIRKNWNNATKAFIESGEEEAIVTIKIPEKALTQLRSRGYPLTGKHTMTLRLCKGIDDKGNAVYYVTDILDSQDLSAEEIHYNYSLRWESETAIDVVKNKLQLACFSGHLEQVIRQDFHATICIYNLSQVMHNHAMEILMEKDEAKIEMQDSFNQKMAIENLPLRKVNHSLVIGLLGFLIFDIFGNKKNWKKSYLNLIDLIVRFPEKVRHNRSFEIKYKINKSRGRFWYHTNFKRPA